LILDTKSETYAFPVVDVVAADPRFAGDFILGIGRSEIVF